MAESFFTSGGCTALPLRCQFQAIPMELAEHLVLQEHTLTHYPQAEGDRNAGNAVNVPSCLQVKGLLQIKRGHIWLVIAQANWFQSFAPSALKKFVMP